MADKWLEAICISKVICEKCEDAHLNSHGEQFFSSHELFANIQDSVHGFADDVMEVYFGARGSKFPSSNMILKGMTSIIPTESSNVQVLAKQLKDLIADLIDVLQDITTDNDTTIAEQDLASSTARVLQQKIYFLNRFLSKE